jgi:DNA-binding LytR/AlgR family response regulator
MNVLIVENEKPAAEKLQRLLKKIDGNIVVTGITETVEGTVNWFQNNALPDIILMDIQLDDGLCFEIFETIKIDVPVIFTTAFNDYMLRAFKVNSIDYLLKPIEEDSLKNAIAKFKSLQVKITGDMIKQLFGEIGKQYKTRFLIKIGMHYRSVPVDEICCFFILERAVFIRTIAGKEYSVDNSLDNLQKTVDPEKFFRINRNCLVNFNAIRDILSFSSSRLQLKLNENIPGFDDEYFVVSRDKVSEFKKWLSK